jgi:hypothetical protein
LSDACFVNDSATPLTCTFKRWELPSILQDWRQYHD